MNSDAALEKANNEKTYRVNRSRGLSNLDERLGASFPVLSTIRGLLAERGALEVLEVGFGYGHTLLELAWLFRDKGIRFHGVDKRPNVTTMEDLRQIALDFGVASRLEIDALALPFIYEYDATTLQFENESLDFIYSAFVVRFMERKDKFLEEVCRVLKPGGRAILHIGGANWNYPYGRTINRRHLTNYLNRFVLTHADELIPLPVYLKLFEGSSFKFEFSDGPHCILKIHKLQSGNLNLELEYNNKLSMPGRKLPLRNRTGVIKGGFRSVYEVRGEHYDNLFERGLLTIEYLKRGVERRT
ncbi:class I SAM-dependent methyltransferase [Nitrosomonas sp.]|uniref:class I SAM-dependent methyltransferase n=1 Tax=Nitrosomonas sp. TaxID=42353 RepID=UPI0025E4CDBC|nr:class I SAM-dependent methyltransferase [Nitrosomonas sp.]